jgi:indole-3-glycerol phosphate synthase
VYLDAILARHRAVAAADRRDTGALRAAATAAPPPRGFAARLRADAADGLAVIAEIKRRSPSRGDLAPGLDPAEAARDYARGGASCLSVLTDAEAFGGSAEDLAAARAAVGLPVLRKDFTVDVRDVYDARLMGADAVLLIAAALDAPTLRRCLAAAREVGLDALVEVHDAAEVSVALDEGATMVGVNQRDLRTFEVDRGRAAALAELVPAGVLRVAESGVRTEGDARALRACGYDAVLVGEGVVTSADRAAAVAALRVAP